MSKCLVENSCGSHTHSNTRVSIYVHMSVGSSPAIKVPHVLAAPCTKSFGSRDTTLLQFTVEAGLDSQNRLRY